MKILELKSTIREIKNLSERVSTNIRLEEDRISELEVKSLEIIQFEEQKRNMKENEQSLRNPWDIIKYTNILIRGIPEGEEGEWSRKKLKIQGVKTCKNVKNISLHL